MALRKKKKAKNQESYNEIAFSSQLQDITKQPETNISKFSFHYFDSKVDEWKYYLQRFELEADICEISDRPELKKKLLLTWIGSDIYKITADNFDPRLLTQVSYDEIIIFLTSYFQPTLHFLSER